MEFLRGPCTATAPGIVASSSTLQNRKPLWPRNCEGRRRFASPGATAVGPSRWAVLRPVHIASGVARSAWRSNARPGGSSPTVRSGPAILRAWRRASRNSARSAAEVGVARQPCGGVEGMVGFDGLRNSARRRRAAGADRRPG